MKKRIAASSDITQVINPEPATEGAKTEVCDPSRTRAPSGISKRKKSQSSEQGSTHWEPAPSLPPSEPSDDVYVVRNVEEGESAVGFGDGISGGSLPSGRSGLGAAYREYCAKCGTLMPINAECCPNCGQAN